MEQLAASLGNTQQLVERLWQVFYIKDSFLLAEFFRFDLFFLVDVDDEYLSCFIRCEEILVVGIPGEGGEEFFVRVLPLLELLAAENFICDYFLVVANCEKCVFTRNLGGINKKVGGGELLLGSV